MAFRTWSSARSAPVLTAARKPTRHPVGPGSSSSSNGRRPGRRSPSPCQRGTPLPRIPSGAYAGDSETSGGGSKRGRAVAVDERDIRSGTIEELAQTVSDADKRELIHSVQSAPDVL